MESYILTLLGDIDEAFTWISKKVLQKGVMSIVSYNPAEIFHHVKRRLTNPTEILAAENLVPLTAFEHTMVHDGKIVVVNTGFGRFAVTDMNGAHFLANTMEFMKLWNYYVKEWIEKGAGK